MDQDVWEEGMKESGNLPKSCSSDLGVLGVLGFPEEGLAPSHLNMKEKIENLRHFD